jgi:neopullulanase
MDSLLIPPNSLEVWTNDPTFEIVILTHRPELLMEKRLLVYLVWTILIGFPNLINGAAKNQISRIDPAFWWVGMKNPHLELLVYHPGIGKASVSIDYPGVRIEKVEPAENPDYLYLHLNIGTDAKAGIFPVKFSLGKNKLSYLYELRQRSSEPGRVQGISNADFIYLAMPDRFANGDPANDVIKGSMEPFINRDSMYWRHGGDIQGVRDRIPYLKDLGITAIWLTPVQENNQPKVSYHGYAITDHYRIDPRFGTNELYKSMVDDFHRNGMKVVMDIVPNHIGNNHWLYKNLPSNDWVHQFEKFTKTNYRAPALMDPYASAYDKDLMRNGWFDTHMPDLNQDNPHVARYLTQSYIWWVEYTGLDAFRIDTYPYPDQSYLADMAKDILYEYPGIGMFAEIWDHGVPMQGWFSGGFKARKGDSYLPSVLDFQIYFAINDALTKDFGWTDGAARLYYVLAQDFLYEDAFRNVIFLDNHDQSRFLSVVGEDLSKYKTGLNWLMTLRGTPHLYYGTEILMKNFSDPDGKVRSDFPGGWKQDPQNKFTVGGRDAREEEAFSHLRSLAQWRLKSKAVLQGKLMQFVPEKGLYVYFRYTAGETVMVIANCSKTANSLDVDRYDEMLGGKRSGTEVVSGMNINLQGLVLQPWQSMVLEIK